MPVSKRVRYEVLRRDNHACRYCGGRAPDVPLVVDHVTPVALGGTDEPSNLVAACRDCNSGKTSTIPDAPLVDDVRQGAIRYAAAMRQAAADLAGEREPERQYVDAFRKAWSSHSCGDDSPIPSPSDWQASIVGFRNAGLPIEDVLDAVRLAMANTSVTNVNVWRYFCGVCWNRLRALQERAHAILDAPQDRAETNALLDAIAAWQLVDIAAVHS